MTTPRAPIDLGSVLSRLDDCDHADRRGDDEGEERALPPMATFGGALSAFALKQEPGADPAASSTWRIKAEGVKAEEVKCEDVKAEHVEESEVIVVQIGKRDVKPRRKAPGATARKPASTARQAKIHDLLSVVSGNEGTTAATDGDGGASEKKPRKARVAKPKASKAPKEPKPPKEPKVRVARPKKAKVLNITERALAAYAAPALTAGAELPSCAQTTADITQYMSPTKTAAAQTEASTGATGATLGSAAMATAVSAPVTTTMAAPTCIPVRARRAAAGGAKPKPKAKAKPNGKSKARIVEPPPLPLLSPRSACRGIARQRTAFARRGQVDDAARVHPLGVSALLGVGKQLWFAANRGLEGEMTDGGKRATLITAPEDGEVRETTAVVEAARQAFDTVSPRPAITEAPVCEPELPPTASLSEVLQRLESSGHSHDLAADPEDNYNLEDSFMPLYSQEYLRLLVGSSDPAPEAPIGESAPGATADRDPDLRTGTLSQEFPVSMQHQDSSSSAIDRVALRVSDAAVAIVDAEPGAVVIEQTAQCGGQSLGRDSSSPHATSSRPTSASGSVSRKRKSDASVIEVRAKSPRLSTGVVHVSSQEAPSSERVESALPSMVTRSAPISTTVISSEDEDEALDSRPLAQLNATSRPSSARAAQPEVLIVPDSEDEGESLTVILSQPLSPAVRRVGAGVQTLTTVAVSQSTLASHGFRVNKHSSTFASAARGVSSVKPFGKENLPILPIFTTTTASSLHDPVKVSWMRAMSSTATAQASRVDADVVDLSAVDREAEVVDLGNSADDAIALTAGAAAGAGAPATDLSRPTSRAAELGHASPGKSPRKPRESAAEKQARLEAAKEARACAKLDRDRARDAAKAAQKLQRVQEKADKKRQADMDRIDRRHHLAHTLTNLLTTDVGMAAFYDKMLRYEPVVIDDLVDHLQKRYDIKADVEEVRDYLDAKSICCARRTTRKGMARKRL